MDTTNRSTTDASSSTRLATDESRFLTDVTPAGQLRKAVCCELFGTVGYEGRAAARPPPQRGPEGLVLRGRIMGSLDLLLICTSAFIAVFVLLLALALVMRGLMAVFPVRAALTDTAMLAAVAAAVSVAYPGARISKIEETR